MTSPKFLPPRIKICGITSQKDALAAIELGADAIGLVFYPPSPRAILPDHAAQWVRKLPPFVTVTGLFVNATQEEILEVSDWVGLDVVQLHGDESPAFCHSLPKRVIKAIRVATAADLERVGLYEVSALLYDAKISGVYGGSGQAFDWSILAHHSGGIPRILAGGLNPDNVALAVRMVQPYAVDVSSGVESSPGIKDHLLMARFVDATRRGWSSRFHREGENP